MGGITDDKGVPITDPDKGGLGAAGIAPFGMVTVTVLPLRTSLHLKKLVNSNTLTTRLSGSITGFRLLSWLALTMLDIPFDDVVRWLVMVLLMAVAYWEVRSLMLQFC